MPEGFSWYSLRAADVTPIFSAVRAGTYIKLPGMVFWTYVNPPDPGGWRGTRIGKRGTMRSARQHVSDGLFGQFLVDRAEEVFVRAKGLSARQRLKIESSITQNPDRAANSLSFAAYLDDRRRRESEGGE